MARVPPQGLLPQFNGKIDLPGSDANLPDEEVILGGHRLSVQSVENRRDAFLVRLGRRARDSTRSAWGSSWSFLS